MCGEKFRAYAKIWNEWGSPPRMRGKAFLSSISYIFFGITPACAGKRCFVRFVLLVLEDHPRMCGEKLRQM